MRNFIKFYLMNTSIAGFFFVTLTLLGPKPEHKDWAIDILALISLGWIIGWIFRRTIKGIITSSADAKGAIIDLTQGNQSRVHHIDVSRDKIDDE